MRLIKDTNWDSNTGVYIIFLILFFVGFGIVVGYLAHDVVNVNLSMNEVKTLQFSNNGPTFQAGLWLVNQPIYHQIDRASVNLVYGGYFSVNDTLCHVVYCQFKSTRSYTEDGAAFTKTTPHQINMYLANTGTVSSFMPVDGRGELLLTPDGTGGLGRLPSINEVGVVAAILDEEHDLAQGWDDAWLEE